MEAYLPKIRKIMGVKGDRREKDARVEETAARLRCLMDTGGLSSYSRIELRSLPIYGRVAMVYVKKDSWLSRYHGVKCASIMIPQHTDIELALHGEDEEGLYYGHPMLSNVETFNKLANLVAFMEALAQPPKE